MRYFIILCLFCLNLSACATERNLNIGVISDIHFLSESLMDDGKAMENYIKSSGRCIKEAPQILDQVISQYLESDIDVLLIPGDLTKNGEKQSHIDLIKKLEPLQKKGVRIYVIPGNHDINVPQPMGYSGETTYPVGNISATDFESLYSDMGYKDALYRDTASLSYVAALDNHTWLFSIDVCRYKEYTTSTISGGRLNKNTEIWLVQMLEKAKKENKTVLGMMHHSLVEHIMYQATLFPQYIVEDYQRLTNLLIENGMKAIFTGHFHANDITEFSLSDKSKIFDIETGSLTSYPFPYRFITLDNEGMDIRTANITSTPSNKNLVEESKGILRNIAKTQMQGKLNNLGFNIPAELKDKMAELGAEIFLLHVAGDEVLTEDIINQLKDISSFMEYTLSDDNAELQLDFSPADNDVRINFD